MTEGSKPPLQEMRLRARDRLLRLAHHPGTNLALGLALFLASLIDLLEDLLVTFDSGIDLQHAVLLFGLVMVVRAATELADTTNSLVRKTRSLKAGRRG